MHPLLRAGVVSFAVSMLLFVFAASRRYSDIGKAASTFLGIAALFFTVLLTVLYLALKRVHKRRALSEADSVE
ncbi:MAG: hypothetical protein KDB86_14210 [Actinobacteria bacterium]|nr:hypothetical protein [Actinomycetota bacterium]